MALLELRSHSQGGRRPGHDSTIVSVLEWHVFYKLTISDIITHWAMVNACKTLAGVPERHNVGDGDVDGRMLLK